MSKIIERMKKEEDRRFAKMQELAKDPFIGYETLDEALADYRFTSQAEVLARLLNRENVFISGPAGSGKTTIINRFIDLIDAEFSGDFEIAVTASTGIAAILINGQTIHSWAGMGISTEPFNPKKIEPMMWNRAKLLKYSDVLIIDEISMLPAYLFEKLDKVLKHFRRNKEPFGGIQLVITGDFLQLPPVRGRDSDEKLNTDYAITTQAWKDANIHHCYMDKTHRAADVKLKYLLSKIANNKVDDVARGLISSRLASKVQPDPHKTYTTLFTTNNNVDDFNRKELSKNPNRSIFVRAEESGRKENIEKIYKNNGVAKEIELKVGATVMLTSNIRDEVSGELFANGSIGVIETFLSGVPRVRFNNGLVLSIEKKMYPLSEKRTFINPDSNKEITYDEIVAYVSQVPLKLGYAITVHKSQGQTFDGVIVDLSKCFTPGLGYVALSRVRTIDDLVITNFNDKAYSIDERSRKISQYVKKRALEERQNFLENRSYYEGLLTMGTARKILWDVTNSGRSKMNKDPF